MPLPRQSALHQVILAQLATVDPKRVTAGQGIGKANPN